MAGVDSVEIVDEWVFKDLSSSKFTDEESESILDDIDELEENLVQWERDLKDAVGMVEDIEGVTVYRRKISYLRSYFVRQGDTLYCIGAGKRKKTYDRDLGKIEARGRELLTD